MRLTRGENGTRTVAPFDLGDAVPTSKDLGYDRRCKGGRGSKHADGGGNSEGAWSRRVIKARADTHAVHELMLQLRPPVGRMTLTANQTATVDHQEWSVTSCSCRVACISRIPG